MPDIDVGNGKTVILQHRFAVPVQHYIFPVSLHHLIIHIHTVSLTLSFEVPAYEVQCWIVILYAEVYPSYIQSSKGIHTQIWFEFHLPQAAQSLSYSILFDLMHQFHNYDIPCDSNELSLFSILFRVSLISVSSSALTFVFCAI